ncbi:MAG TPA: chemotaxis protein CheB [Polyangiaceae bacterium]|nr:chemotaxis protein CheB [Polyangiaceae bacterium]
MLNRGTSDRAAAVVIGGSAGAIQGLLHLLPGLRATSALPIVIVVHLPPRSPSLLTELFSERCALPVREPCDKEPVTSGIWFAPPDYHLLIEKDRTFSLSLDEPDLHSRPSIDALFESAADCYGKTLLGIVLTGASRDGARGVRTICDLGGECFTLAPDGSDDLCTMPRAAVEQGATPVSLADLGDLLRLAADMHPRGRTAVEKYS